MLALALDVAQPGILGKVQCLTVTASPLSQRQFYAKQYLAW